MGYRVHCRVLQNIRSIFRKSTFQSYQNNLFGLKTCNANLTLSVSERNPKFTTSSFWNGPEVTQNFVFRHGLKEENLWNDFNDHFSDKETVNYRFRLYPKIQAADDPCLEAIVNASSIEQVFRLIKDQPLNVMYASQAIATLWDLKKGYYDMTSNTSSTDKTFSQVSFMHCGKFL